ncbi:MAG: hypothetical protein HZA61_14910 [Candidatus Eisenbacteria bacterium]|uniref:Lipoprotein n=1 Tax=Eiseniibacteriota bacterium TaxID=2212470 RepID=A0A933SDW1_UNCEI|nr:hypothetical protein [Candidatus Eisenbacteria bacterium]
MKKHLALAMGLLVLAVAMTGCGKSSSLTSSNGTSGGTAVEQAKVNATLAADLALVEDEVSQDETPVQFDAGMGMGLVRPYRWWRHITSVDRTFDTQFSDPDSTGRPMRALVTVHATLLGTFNVLVGDTAAGDTARRIVSKPLEDHRTRKLLLVRVPVDSTEDDSLHREWRIVGTSGVKVASANGVTNIQSVRVQAGVLDTTVTNPLELWRTRRVFFLPPATQVTLTVTTQSANDLVFLRGFDRRFRFHPNGDGTYTATWLTGDRPLPLQHFGIEAMSRATLFDDAAPYDAQAWILPFAPRRDGCDIEHR